MTATEPSSAWAVTISGNFHSEIRTWNKEWNNCTFLSRKFGKLEWWMLRVFQSLLNFPDSTILKYVKIIVKYVDYLKVHDSQTVPGQHKLRGFLATSLHLELFSLRAYFKVLRQKVPYFNVSRQKIPYFNVSRQKSTIF